MDTLIPEVSPYSEDIYTVPTWSLQKTFTAIATVVSLYLILVLKILPNFMKNRPPYKLKNTLLVYNLFQVACSLYLVFIYGRYILKYDIITTRCPNGRDLQQVLLYIIYPYFTAKHLDLLDTVFFVLRKKQNQVSFLHLYHHATMVTWIWLHLVYHPSDNFVVVGMLNSFIHVLMYGYYAISSLGPEYSKYVWWKRHLTKAQLIQFVFAVSNLHYQQKLSPCPIPEAFHNFCLFVVCSFFVLFINFYIGSYTFKFNKHKNGKKV